MEVQSKSSLLSNPSLIKGALVLTGTFIAYKVGKSIVDDIRKRRAEQQVDDNVNYRQAVILRGAMNPSGISWMKSFDTTNSALIFDSARLITNIDETATAYRNLYSSDLLADLQSELSSEDYQKFLTIISSNPNKEKGSGKTAPVKFTSKGSIIVAIREVTLRTSPDATNHDAVYEVFSESNTVRKAKAGEFIGYATGEQFFDEKNNVKFIQVGFKVEGKNAPKDYKSKNGKRILYWVTSSSTYVRQFKDKGAAYTVYPDLGKYFFWMKPLIEAKPVNGLVARQNTVILNDSLQPIGIAKAHTFLGSLEKTLDCNGNVYYQFRSPQNLKRWVHTSNAKRI